MPSSPQATTLDRVAISGQMHDTLLAAVAERHLREDFVEAPGGLQIAWHLHELDVMTSAVNAARAQAGKGPVAEQDIVIIEGRACGHSDYPRQFAYGCAGLVVGP